MNVAVPLRTQVDWPLLSLRLMEELVEEIKGP